MQSRARAAYPWPSKCLGPSRPLWGKGALGSLLNMWGGQGSSTGPPPADSLAVLNRGPDDFKSNRLFTSPIGLEFSRHQLPTDTLYNLGCQPRRWASSSWSYRRGLERLRNEPQIIRQIHRTANILTPVVCFSKMMLELLVVGMKLLPFTAHRYCLAKTHVGICHLVATGVEVGRGRNLL